MKRLGTWTIAFVLGWLAGICGWHWLRAQAPASPRPPTIAFINYLEVMRQYAEANDIRKQIQAEQQKFLDQLQAKQKEIDELRKQWQAAEPSQRDSLERKIKDLEYQFNNARSDADKYLTRFANERWSQVYFKVWNKVKAVAESNGYEVVFRFNEDWRDANKPEVFYHPDRVMFRLTASNLWPMYYQRTADITGQVIAILNREYQGGATSSSTGK